MRKRKIIRIILAVALLLFLIIGVPIAINECYEANCGYLKVWSKSDILNYYGIILGSTVTVAVFVITVRFTKKRLITDLRNRKKP